MANQYHNQYQCRDEHTIKMPKHLHGSQDIRVLLAEYILNFEFPRDMYAILITGFVIYLSLRLFRFSIRLLFALIRPIILIVLLMVVLPYLIEMKSGIASNRVVNNVYSQGEGFMQTVLNTLNSIYTHTIRFYSKHF